MVTRAQFRAAMRDKLIHYQVSAGATACGRDINYRLSTYEPGTLTCKHCRRALSENPAWRRDAGGRETRIYDRA
jgi:hypothetical protein